MTTPADASPALDDWAAAMAHAAGLDEAPAAAPAETAPDRLLDLAELSELRNRARCGRPVDTNGLTAAGRRLIYGPLDWSLVDGGSSRSGRRLLVVELDADAAEARVLDALAVLAGREG